MCAVYVCICHQANAVVAQAISSEVFAFDPQSQCGDEGLNFVVLVDLGVVGFLNVEDFASLRKNGLESAIASLLRTTTRRVPLHNEDLRFARVTSRTIRQLTG